MSTSRQSTHPDTAVKLDYLHVLYILQKIEKRVDYRKQFFEADINGLHLLELSAPEMAGMMCGNLKSASAYCYYQVLE